LDRGSQKLRVFVLAKSQRKRGAKQQNAVKREEKETKNRDRMNEIE
jgi:hypothetical protein